MTGTSGPRVARLRRLGRASLPIFFVAIGIAAVRGGLGIPQNGFVGLFLLAAAAILAITSLLRAGRGGDE